MVEVFYKSFNASGEFRVEKEWFELWSEDGNYTIFYDDENSSSLIIPTANIINIRILNG